MRYELLLQPNGSMNTLLDRDKQLTIRTDQATLVFVASPAKKIFPRGAASCAG